MVEPPPMAKGVGNLPGRDWLGVGLSNATATGTDAFRERLVEEMAGVCLGPEPDLAPASPVGWPDHPAFLGQARDDLVEHVAELSTRIAQHLGGPGQPVRFTQCLGRPPGNAN